MLTYYAPMLFYLFLALLIGIPCAVFGYLLSEGLKGR